MHQQRAALGQFGLLAGFDVHGIQLVDGMAQEFLFAARGFQLGRRLAACRRRMAPRAMQARDLRHIALQAAEGVEQQAVGRGLHQALVLELAVDLDKVLADLAHQRDADRLVVDEGPRPAVAAHRAPQDQRFAGLGGDALLVQGGPGRVVGGDVELGDHHRLRGAGSDERGLGAFAESQPEGVEKDGFAGAGLAGQHAEPRLERQVEAVDEDDVAD